MNHRERVLAALHHEEPDRVPIDLGGTVDTSILAAPYKELRVRLGLGPGTVYISDVVCQEVVIEDDVRRALGTDTKGIFYEPQDWRPVRLSDGSPAYYPATFRPQAQADGSQVVRDAAGHVLLKMPRNGHYFDPVYAPLANARNTQDIDQQLDALEAYDRPAYLDASYEQLAQKARLLHEQSDYLLIGFFGGHIFQAGQVLRGWERFLVDLLTERPFAEALMDRLTEAHMRRFKKYADTIGRYVQVIHVEDDLGMEDRPLLSPELYRRMVKPFHQKLYGYIKSTCDAHLMLHSDGAVYPLIPDFIQMGVDILNPVQVSAKDMDTKRLKAEYGQDIVFWGGGCDSQSTLPFGTAQQVRDEVKRRIDDLAPGGGFVFTHIHNIQPDVPSENIVAMYETARDYGVY